MISRLTAGLVAVLVGYTASVAIVFQAAHAAGASPDVVGSWLFALGLGMGLSSMGLSWWTKAPILTAWSTPGAALLATSLPGLPMAESIGVFLVASALTAMVGVLGAFDRLMRWIPQALASAMLAGVLLRFGMGAFSGLSVDAPLVLGMFTVYWLGRRVWPRYAVPAALLFGVLWAVAGGAFTGKSIALEWATPVWVTPSFSWQSVVGVGLPLFIVTMASQNVPGVAVLRANGYQTPVSPLLTRIGLMGLLLGPLGGYQFNLAAITAAICMTPDADPDPNKRYQAAMWAGAFYALMGLFGATVAGLFAALPPVLVATIAGLALLPTVANSLLQTVAEPDQRDAAVVTFLVTASGVQLWGIASAFWGLVLGLVTVLILRVKSEKAK